MKAKKKRNKKNAGMIGLFLILIALVISVGTYAYYQTTITGSVSGNVLEWECKANGSATSFALTLGELYPGKTGSWAIDLSVKNFSATFTIGLDAGSATNLDNVIFKHNDNVLCKNANEEDCLHTYTKVVNAGSGTTGNVTDSTIISYEWPLGSAQTNVPTTNKDASVTIRIVCTQNDAAPYNQNN